MLMISQKIVFLMHFLAKSPAESQGWEQKNVTSKHILLQPRKIYILYTSSKCRIFMQMMWIKVWVRKNKFVPKVRINIVDGSTKIILLNVYNLFNEEAFN